MIRECKKAAWQELKSKRIILYSAVYFIFTAIFNEVTDMLIGTLSTPSSAVSDVVYTVLTNCIIFPFSLGYMHTIISPEPKPDGFFTFFAPKHLKFILLTLLLLIIPYNVFNYFKYHFAADGRTTMELLSSTISLFFSYLVAIFKVLHSQTTYFKAIFPENSFFENIVQTIKFIFGHFVKFILFNLTFLLWKLAQTMIAYIFLMKFDLEIVSTILQMVILAVYSPYYVLSLKRFVNSCE